MKVCRILTLLFAALWLFALAILAIGTFGWFGQEKDPLSGIFLIPLGLPWNRFADALGLAVPIVGILAPGLNLLILFLVCRFIARRT